jgi:hypothetical protein
LGSVKARQASVLVAAGALAFFFGFVRAWFVSCFAAKHQNGFGIQKGAFRSFVNRLQKSTLFLSGRDAFCRSFSQFCLAFYKKPERHPQGEHGFEAIGKRSAWGLRA